LQPVVQFSFQHQLNTVPRWIVPGRRGSIDGHVFVDNSYLQAYTRGAAPLEGVLIYLDGRRTAHTDKNGYFAFHGVPWGAHTVQVDFHDSRAFYYTSSSPKEVPAGGTADFGISFAKGRIFGRFLSDAGDGLAVTLDVEGRGINRQVNTDGDGYVEIDGLPNGTFTIHPDDSSLPAGYSLADLNDQTVPVTAVKAGNFKFVVQAQRSIAGTVELFDQTTAHMQPLAGADVSIGSASVKSDSAGRYLFRHLPAGPYTVTVTYNGKTWTRIVQLGTSPDIESGVDIMVTQALPPPAPHVTLAPVAPPALKDQRLMRENRRREPKSRSSLRERNRDHDRASNNGMAQ
jgi:Carboxypeptidase regulatory-like domain